MRFPPYRFVTYTFYLKSLFDQREKSYLTSLLFAITYNLYLAEVEAQAQLLFDNIVKQLFEEENVNEYLKASNPMNSRFQRCVERPYRFVVMHTGRFVI